MVKVESLTPSLRPLLSQLKAPTRQWSAVKVSRPWAQQLAWLLKRPYSRSKKRYLPKWSPKEEPALNSPSMRMTPYLSA